MKKITIVTPTYNRATELNNLYRSLVSQTSNQFEWLVIDDGSEDDTSGVINRLKNENMIEIKYIHKSNGGKHTALNTAFELINTDLMMIVDSDDVLVPNCIERILCVWEKYKQNKTICGMVFRKGDTNGGEVSQRFRDSEFVENYNKYVINGHVRGDKEEIFKTEVIKKYKYPVYRGEKFIGEGVLWSKIARNYDMVFVDEVIYLCQYLDGGLTKSGRIMRINNPQGGMYHALEYIDKIYCIDIREKNAILYLVYARFAKMDILRLIKNSKHKIFLILNVIPSFIIYILWKEKNRKER